MNVTGTVPMGDWVEQAACKGKPTAIFFPSSAGSGTTLAKRNFDLYDHARSICAGCPVIEQCLQYALDVTASGQTLVGCWAGTDEHQRRAMAARPREHHGWAS